MNIRKRRGDRLHGAGTVQREGRGGMGENYDIDQRFTGGGL